MVTAATKGDARAMWTAFSTPWADSRMGMSHMGWVSPWAFWTLVDLRLHLLDLTRGLHLGDEDHLRTLRDHHLQILQSQGPPG